MAGRRCTVCAHPDRPAIDQAMVNRRPFRDIARHFGIGKDAAVRHHDACLPAELTKAKQAADVANADDLLTQLRALRTKSLQLMMAAERAGDLRTALAGIRETRATLELLAELSAQLDRRPTLNLLVAPEWLTMRSTLVEALRPYPDARAAVASALVALEHPA